MKGFTTRSIHGSSDSLQKKDFHRSLKMPVYESAAYEFDSSEDIALAFEGKKAAHSYSRVTNPTVAELELRLKNLSGAEGCLCVGSGMAAITNVLLSLCRTGDNIVTSPYLFGNTIGFYDNTLKPFGVEIRFADMEDPRRVEELIDEKTQAVFLENISNPLLKVFDIAGIAEAAHKRNTLLIVDNTLLTPYLFSGKKHGADIEILSNTKYISGGGTGVGGTILLYDQGVWSRRPEGDCSGFHQNIRKNFYRNFGACLSPHSAFLQLLGLETLALRVDRSCQNALSLAEFLMNRKEVLSVHYPGHPENPSYHLVKKQSRGRSGGLIMFEMESREACFRMMNRLQVIRRATNFCDNKSLIIHPVSTIFCEYKPEDIKLMGLNDRMIRFSVGIEDVQDLEEDLAQAFSS